MAKKKNLKSTVANAAAKAKAEAQKKQQGTTKANTAAAKKSPASFAPAKRESGLARTSPSSLVNRNTTAQGKKTQAANFQNRTSYKPQARRRVWKGKDLSGANPIERMKTANGTRFSPMDYMVARNTAEFMDTGKTLQQIAMERASRLTKEEARSIQRKRDTDAKAMQDRLKRQSKIEISAYDKKLPKTQQQMIREAKSEYETAKAWGDREGMKQAHAKAEEARHNAGYSGGAWGNQHIAPGLTAKDRQRMAGLDEKGRNAYLRTKYDKMKAATNNDADGVRRFESDLDKIAGSDYYRDRGNVNDFSGHGTSRIGAARKQEQGESFKAGAKSLAYGIPGSIMSIGETTDAALAQLEGKLFRKQYREIALDVPTLRGQIAAVKRGEGNPEWGTLEELEKKLARAEYAEKIGYGNIEVDSNARGQQWMKKSQEYAAQALAAAKNHADRKTADLLMNAGNMLPALAAGLIPGAGPIVGPVLFGAQAAGDKAYELNSKLERISDDGEFYKVSPLESTLRSFIAGGAEIATGAIPMGKFAKFVKGNTGQKAAKFILDEVLGEGAEEGVTYAVNYIADKAFRDPTAAFSAKELAENIVTGALLGGVMGGAGVGIRTGLDSLSSSDPGNLGGAAELQSMRGKTPLEQSNVKFQKLEQQIRADQQNGTMSEEKARAYAKELVSLRDTIRAQQAEVQRASEASNPLALAAQEVAAERTGQIPTERLRGQNETAVKAEKSEAPTRKAVVRSADGTTQEVVLTKNANTTQAKANRLNPENIRLRPVEENGVQSRQEPVVNRPTESLTRSAQTLGESGRKALMSVRDGNVSDADYFEGFAKVYNQAMNGVESKSIKLPDALTDAQAHAAFSAGVNDRAVLAEERKNAARFASVAGEDAGLVYDQYVSRQLGSGTAEAVNEVSKMLGVRTVFVDSVNGGRANAQIQGNVIQVEKFNTNPVRTIFGHEITHRVQELAPESYQAFREYVMQDSKARDAIDEVVENYRQHGLTISQEQAANEVIADYAGDLINDRNLLEKFVRDNKSNKTLLEKFLSVLRDIAAKLKGSIHKTNVDEAVKLLENAMGEAAAQVERIESGEFEKDGLHAGESFYEDGNGHALLSIKTYEDEGRAKLKKFLKNEVKRHHLEKEDADAMFDEMEMIYSISKRYEDKYAPFSKWSKAEVVYGEDGKPVFSCVKKNGEYPMNIDYSLNCKKRRPLDAVLNKMVEMGVIEKFAMNKQSLVFVNKIIREYGMETACAICFVDTKRYRITEIADNFVDMYNGIVTSMVPEEESYGIDYFNFGKDKTVDRVTNGLDKVDDGNLDFTYIDEIIKTTGEKTVQNKIARHLKDNPADRKLLRRGDFVSTVGFDNTAIENPAIMKLYNSKKGASGPKASFSDVQYLSEIISRRTFNRKKAYAVGGVRIQSFSDYVPRLFFDYCQMFADLSAKRLPAHSYTKEILFVKQFGMTGTKINMSLIPKYVEGGKAAGLDADGNYAWQEGQSFASTVNEPSSADEGFRKAVEIQNAPGYDDNCGTIAVGVSDAHIEKMLDDPRIRMIIPYHYSSLNPIVAKMNFIDAFTDYTDKQNTRHQDGTVVEDDYYDFNAVYHKLGDAKAAAADYLKWCGEHNYLPKFDKWKGHENYYKLLIDFASYNSKGKATPQGDVQMKFPKNGDAFGSLEDLVVQGLEEDAALEFALDENVVKIIDEVQKRLPEMEKKWEKNPMDFDEDGDGGTLSLKTNGERRNLVEEFSNVGGKKVRKPQTAREQAFADDIYYGKKVSKERAKGREAVQKERAKGQEKLAAEKARRTSEAARWKQERREMQAAHKDELRSQRAEDRAYYTEKHEKQIRELKDRFAARQDAQRESRKAAELRVKIVKHAGQLRDKLMNPTDTKHIPDGLRGVVKNALSYINLESGFDRGDGKRVPRGQGEATKRTLAFMEMRKAFQEIEQSGDASMSIDPDLADNIEMIESMKDVPIASMTSSELETVWRVIKAVETAVSTANKMLGRQKFEMVDEFAQAIKNENAGKRPKKDYRGPIRAMDKLINSGMLVPEAFFHRLGESGKALFKMMRGAQDKNITILDEAVQKTRDLFGKTDVYKIGKQTRKFTFDGETLEVPVADIMQFYLSLKREQYIDHIVIGGVKFGPVNKGVTRVRNTESLRFTPEQISEMIDTLTDEEIRLCDGMQRIVAETAEYGNAATLAVYGYKKFEGKNYWPIKVDRNEVNKDVANEAKAATIAGRGFAKSTRPHANNAVIMGNVFDVFVDHIVDMANYASWLAPMENMARVYNFRFKDEDGGFHGSVKDVIDNVFGENGKTYMEKLMADLNSGVKATNDNPFDTFVRNLKVASVAANIRVFAQQPTAIIRALDSINPMDFVAASFKMRPGTWNKVREYAPIAVWKDWGYFDSNTGRQMKSLFFGEEKKLDAVNNALLAPAGAMDSLAWSHIWNALEVETGRKRKDLEKGSEEFYEAVAERFNEVIDHTQVVDGILQRSDLMRSPDGVTKMATSFKAEPTKIYNMFTTAWYDLRNSQDPKARAKARKTMGKTAFALTLSIAVNAAVQAVVDAYRDDDDDETYKEKFLQAFTGIEGEEETRMDYLKSIAKGDLGEGFNPFGYIAFVSDVVSILEGYDVKRMDMESISKFVKAASNVVKTMNGNGKNTKKEAYINMMAEFAKMVGLPLSNIKRDLYALIHTYANGVGNHKLQYEFAKFLYNEENKNNKGLFLDIAYKAWRDGDEELFQTISQDLMDIFGNEAVNGKTIDEAMRKRLEKDMEKHEDLTFTELILNGIGKRTKYNSDGATAEEDKFTEESLTAAQYDQFADLRAKYFRELESAAKSNAAWGQLTSKDKDSLADKLWGFARQKAMKELHGDKFNLDEKYNKLFAAEEIAIAPAVYQLISNSITKINGEQTVDGVTIDNSRGYKRFMALRDSGLTEGMSEDQLAFVYDAMEIGAAVRSLNESGLQKLGEEIEAKKTAESKYNIIGEEYRDLVVDFEKFFESCHSEYENGKKVKGQQKQDKVKRQIDSYDIPRSAKAELWRMCGYSDKKNPYL